MFKNQKELDYLLELMSMISIETASLSAKKDKALEIWSNLSEAEKQYIRNRRSDLRAHL